MYSTRDTPPTRITTSLIQKHYHSQTMWHVDTTDPSTPTRPKTPIVAIKARPSIQAVQSPKTQSTLGDRSCNPKRARDAGTIPSQNFPDRGEFLFHDEVILTYAFHPFVVRKNLEYVCRLQNVNAEIVRLCIVCRVYCKKEEHSLAVRGSLISQTFRHCCNSNFLRGSATRLWGIFGGQFGVIR